MHESDVVEMAGVLVGAPDPEIVELEARIRAAQLGADATALDALLADDLLFTGPDGAIGSKADDLAAHASGVVRFVEHVPRELRVRRVGREQRWHGGVGLEPRREAHAIDHDRLRDERPDGQEHDGLQPSRGSEDHRTQR